MRILQSLLVFAAVFHCEPRSDISPEYYHHTVKKAYACENSSITISCKNLEVIRIERANYGRFNLQTCNQIGKTEGWMIPCMARTSLTIVAERCDGHNSCMFTASNDVFGDPCPNTYKYVEVHYTCESVSENIFTSRPYPTTAAPTQYSSTSSKTTKLSTHHQIITDKQPISIAASSEPGEIRMPGLHNGYCKATVAQGIQWPDTVRGKTERQPCPDGMSGFAQWTCGKKWIGQPNLSDCVSSWMDEMLNSTSKAEDAMEMVKIHTSTRKLRAGDIKKAARKLLPDLVKQMKRQHPSKEKMKSFTKMVIESGSNLLSKSQRDSWGEIPRVERSKAVTSMIISMEEMAFDYAAMMDTPGSLTSSGDNIFLEVKVVKKMGLAKHDVVLPSASNQPDEKWSNMVDKIVLPLDSLPSKKDENVQVSFLMYQNLGEMLSSAADEEDPDQEGQGEQESMTLTINTNIISASVNGGQRITKLKRPVVFTLNHTTIMTNTRYIPLCSFWDFDPSNLTGHWSQEGCQVISSCPSSTTCQCDHLTNFAVLMDVSGTDLSQVHEMSLTAITYVGCTISILCLFISFLTFTLFRNLQSDRNTIHKNLVLCLMIAELIFLFGIAQTSNQTVCAVIAGLLHFFFLTAFAWMCLEGVQLYFMLIEVFEAERSRIKWFYLFGYGVPAVIVGISAAVKHTGYGTERHCWISTDDWFILSFVLPVAAVLLVNFVMLGIAVRMMCRHARLTAAPMRLKDKSKFEKIGNNSNSMISEAASKTYMEIPTWLRGAAVLVVLLGLTWVFGVMFLSEESVAMAYIFTIFNSLQGVFIFIFHCLLDRKVKKEYRKIIQRASWLPDCVRVNIGGYTGSLSSPNQSSSTGQNYFFRFLSSRIRKRSSSSSSVKTSSQRNRRSDMDSFLSSQDSTTGTKLNRYSNQSEKLLHNGHHNVLATCCEDGIVGDLSVMDGSVIDTEYVTEYCQKNMMVYQEEKEYSSASEADEDNALIHNMDKSNVSLLSENSAVKIRSEFVSSELDDGNLSFSNLSSKDYSCSTCQKPTAERSVSEQNLLNKLVSLMKGENTEEGICKPNFHSAGCLDAEDKIHTETENNSAPNLQYLPKAQENGLVVKCGKPVHGSLPDLSDIPEGEDDIEMDQLSRSDVTGFKPCV
ncbi:hypothetical protein ACJMK2_041436 [Sinanodonta woodiana]|uniref:Uncharacterized protein n=1 Tax=Sinanodonta woodiana TaxID=1069815 RepID=A0ABD3W745_SINWO